jgi:hypothetical protein
LLLGKLRVVSHSAPLTSTSLEALMLPQLAP